MKKIVFRLICSLIIALPVWIILKDLWVGVFVAFLAYMIIHFIQFLAWTKIGTIYEYLTQHFINPETGKHYNASELQQIIESEPSYMRKFQKVLKRYL